MKSVTKLAAVISILFIGSLASCSTSTSEEGVVVDSVATQVSDTVVVDTVKVITIDTVKSK